MDCQSAGCKIFKGHDFFSQWETAAELARVTVTRTEPNDVRHRQIVLSMDGELLGTLLFGQTWDR